MYFSGWWWHCSTHTVSRNNKWDTQHTRPMNSQCMHMQAVQKHSDRGRKTCYVIIIARQWICVLMNGPTTHTSLHTQLPHKVCMCPYSTQCATHHTAQNRSMYQWWHCSTHTVSKEQQNGTHDTLPLDQWIANAHTCKQYRNTATERKRDLLCNYHSKTVDMCSYEWTHYPYIIAHSTSSQGMHVSI